MSDLSKLNAEVAALSTKLDAFVAASAPSDQKIVDDTTAKVRDLSSKIDRLTPKAGDVAVHKA
jgi:outer membrane murein-binding lipoprotein Lpp